MRHTMVIHYVPDLGVVLVFGGDFRHKVNTKDVIVDGFSIKSEYVNVRHATLASIRSENI